MSTAPEPTEAAGTPVPVPVPSSFLLLHGFENHRPTSHWQRWLSVELTMRGHDVRYPQLPDPDAPDLEAWRATMLANFATLTEGTVTVVCHSLSSLMWLNEQRRDAAPQVDRVALVSPPEAAVARGIAPIHDFVWAPQEGIRQSVGAPDAIVVVGDDDEFAPHGVDAVAPFVEARGVTIPGGGHLVPASGFGPWPAILAWCLGEGGL